MAFMKRLLKRGAEFRSRSIEVRIYQCFIQFQ